MKSVGMRFVLPFGLLAVLFSIFVLYRTYTVSRQHANELISQQAALALEFNLAIRDYAALKIRPIMEGFVGKDDFIPETMSTSFISRSIFEEVRKKFPDYIIRFASDRPRNPLNQANADERRMIEYFRGNPQVRRKTEKIQIDGRPYLAHFTPRWMEKECLHCHGDPKDAPAALVKRYGLTSSFHRTPGDVAGLDIVAVPVEKVYASLASEMRRQSMILVAGLALLFGSVMVVFRLVVTKRLAAMASHFHAIAAHPESQQMTPVEIGRYDEIGVLGAAFNKLMEQLRSTHASLELRVIQRTSELEQANSELRHEILDRKQVEEALHRSEEEAKQLARENAVIAEIGRVISSTLNVDEVYDRFAEEVRKLIAFDRIVISIIDREKMTGISSYIAGQEVSDRSPGIPYSLEGTGLAEMIRLNESVLIQSEDLNELKDRLPMLLSTFQAGFRSIMDVPLYDKGQIIGGLLLRSVQPNAYTSKDLKLAERVGVQIAGAIANAQLFSDRVRAETALSNERRRFQLLSENAPVGMVMVDQDGTFKYMNPKFRDLFGYDLQDVPNGKAWFGAAYPDPAYRRQVISTWKKDTEGIRPGERIPRTFTVACKDGTRKTAHFITVQLETRENLTVCIDITDRIRAEEEIKYTLSLLNATLESTADGVLVVDRDGKIERCNQKFIQMWRIPEAVIASADDNRALAFVLDQLNDPDSFIAKVSELYGKPAAESYDVLEFKDGRVFERYSQPQRIGEAIAGRVWSFRDVTKRRLAEKDLQQSEKQARQLAQENAIMAEIGRIISSTLAIEKVYERFAEEVRKVIPFDRIVIDLSHPEKRAVAIAYVSGIDIAGRRMGDVISYEGSDTEHIINTRSSLFIQTEDENEISRRFPSILPTFRAGIRSMMSVPLISKDQVIGGLHIRSVQPNAYTESELRLAERIGNQIAGAIANARLFTERQRLEERLNRAEKMEALGTLAGGVAHDLNNVLGVLVGYSELLLMEIPEGSPLRRHVSNILQSGQRGAAIIQDLLTLARRGVAVSQVINLNHVIADVFRAPEFEKLKTYHPLVTFKSDLDKDLMNVKGSPVHLGKTIMNLLSNAAEAISGQGEVTIVAQNLYLDRPVTGYDHIQEGDYVVVRVSDNGKGISREDTGKIFEPFYTKKVMGRSGTGLGLAIVWGTVQDHHGYIDVQSEEGRGSTFALYFPITREEMVKDQPSILPELYQGRGESILVVDDVKEQRELATTMLSKLGYQVHAVSSGEEAVAYLKATRVELVVLDMIMDPGMDGLETYQKALEINPKQKAIIVSGFSETDRVKRAQELGAGTYVRKPYILEKIGLAVRRELDK